MKSLVQKYNVAGPRYTSYPTVPYWDNDKFTVDKWKSSLVNSYKLHNTNQGISLYIHLPFCESLCTFCSCNKRITKQHSVEMPYIKALLKEWQLYKELLEEKPLIKEIHLGGGTPTFFSTENLKFLINEILKDARLAKDYEFSFEGHPNNTTKEHLQTLFQLGFNRVSFGVQDYSHRVQHAIHRLQTFHQVAKVTYLAKEIGYKSISHDLVFGLPFQDLEDILDTIDKTKSLMPHRIAFYSYAHVPWIKGNGQRGFNEKDLPKDNQKRLLYEEGKKHLIESGYYEIGMDHFALPEDNMYKAFKNHTLHRNFMGYTVSNTQIMIGLGVSSISDSWHSFAQNEKNIEQYYTLLDNNIIPVVKGHILSKKDEIIRKHILNIMCHFRTSWADKDLYFNELPKVLESLLEMQNDKLIFIKDNELIVTEAGKPFVRNICMAFDVKLKEEAPQTKLFSLTV